MQLLPVSKRWLHDVAMPTRSSDEKIANIPPFGLRMQQGLKARVEAAAKENGRSLNSEIVARLEKSFGSPLEQRVAELEATVKFLADNAK